VQEIASVSIRRCNILLNAMGAARKIMTDWMASCSHRPRLMRNPAGQTRTLERSRSEMSSLTLRGYVVLRVVSVTD